MNKLILQILILLVLASVSAKADLVGWWRFDDASAPVRDSSSYQNDGSIVGNCLLTSDAVAGSGAMQVGGGYVQLFSCIDGSLYGDFSSGTASLALWIKLDAANPLVPNNGLANIGSWCYPSFYSSTTDTLSLKLFLSSGNAANVSLPPNTDLTAWHHLAVTVDCGDIVAGYKVYFDGQLIGAFPMDGSNGNFLPPDKPRIGATFDVGTNSWSYMMGKIDEVRLYNQALTAGQVQNLVHRADVNNDNVVNYSDIASLTSRWLSGCSAPDWCGGIDINRDSIVNFTDFTYIAQQWLQAAP